MMVGGARDRSLDAGGQLSNSFEPALNSGQTRRMSITCGNASRTRAFEGDAVDGGSAMLSLYASPILRALFSKVGLTTQACTPKSEAAPILNSGFAGP